MDDRYFMEEALKLAAEAAAEGEVPVGCVIVRGTRSWAGAATGVNRIRLLLPMRRLKRLAKPAAIWAAGGCGNVPCM